MAYKRVKALSVQPTNPSYPCDYSVAAGAAVAIITHFYPFMADSIKKLAEQLMKSRINAGVAFAEDTRAGFEMGQRIARKEIQILWSLRWQTDLLFEITRNGERLRYPAIVF